MSSPHATVAALEYEERRPPFYRRRRFRQILFFLAACALLRIAWHATPDLRDLRRAYWYHRCSGYTAPAGQSVYDDDRQTLAALGKDPAYEVISPGSGNPFARRHNDIWQGLASSLGSPLTAPPAFVHARTTSPGGWERLVVIQFGAFHKPTLRHVAFVASLYAGSDVGVGVRSVATQPANCTCSAARPIASASSTVVPTPKTRRASRSRCGLTASRTRSTGNSATGRS